MASPTPSYDSELQMYVEPEHSLDLNVLNYWRWLVETGRLMGDTSPDWEN